MRNPNGYGSVVKLSGNRRRPFTVRKTKGWDDRGYPVYVVIGSFETREDAMIALAEFNKNPYDIDKAKITVKELYEEWLKKKDREDEPIFPFGNEIRFQLLRANL